MARPLEVEVVVVVVVIHDVMLVGVVLVRRCAIVVIAAIEFNDVKRCQVVVERWAVFSRIDAVGGRPGQCGARRVGRSPRRRRRRRRLVRRSRRCHRSRTRR